MKNERKKGVNLTISQYLIGTSRDLLSHRDAENSRRREKLVT